MPSKITAIKPQERRKDRVNIFLDDEYAFSLQSILAAGLRHGQELTEEDVRRLQQQDAVETMYENALHYLSFRPRSEQEMRRHLQKRGADEDITEQVLGRLKRAGLINDAEFVRFWIENRETHRPRSAWVLRTELRQKGISEEQIALALSDLDEESSALNAARRVVSRWESLDEETFYRRLLGYLQRRGFSYEISRRVADHLWAAMEAQKGTALNERALPDEHKERNSKEWE